MDAEYVAEFNGDTQAAKAFAEPLVKDGLVKLNTLFDDYKLDFRLIFFPSNTLAPSKTTDNTSWITAIKNEFDSEYPCISEDCIVVLTAVTSGGHGNSGVALVAAPPISSIVLAHEIGHNLGLQHASLPITQDPLSMCPHNCNMFPSFMCESTGPVKFNSCDYSKLADTQNGVFTTGVTCGLFCHCILWKDAIDPIEGDDYDCAALPTVSLATDQPVLVRGCDPDHSEAMLTVTVRANSSGLTDGILRIRYRESIYDWDAQSMGIDFDQSLPPSGDAFNQLRILDDTVELQIDLAANEEITFHTKISYNPNIGTDPTNNDLPKIIARLTYMDNNTAITKESTISPKAAAPVSGDIPYFISSGQPLVVTDDLTLAGFAGDFVITSPLIFVQKGVKITVPSGVTVRSNPSIKSHILGCDEMWQGVHVASGGTLNIADVTIEDAQFAVNIEKGSAFSAQNCKFLNNNIAVKTDAAGTGKYKITLLSNKYGTTPAGLKPAYSGQTPAPLEKGFAGLYLKNAGAVVVNSDPNTNEPNEFFNLKYGILSYNVPLKVNSAVFEDITRVAKGDGYSAFSNVPTGKAIYAEKLTTTVIPGDDQEITFAHCHTAIETRGATAYIEHTTMMEVTNGIIATNGNYSVAKDNTITAGDRGIELRHASPINPFSGISPTIIGGVSGNTIAMDGNSNGVGINTAGNLLVTVDPNGISSNPAQFTGGNISGNTITLNAGANAINIYTTRNLAVWDNHISLKNSDGKSRGIALNAGEQNAITCNEITGLGTGTYTGLYALHSDRAKLRCNLAEGTGTGLQIEGLLAGKIPTDIAGNTMKNNTTGLLYGTDAITGKQEHRGNRWVGDSTLAEHEGGALVASASLYIVDVLEDSEFLPEDRIPQNWFGDIELEGDSYTCPAPAGSCVKVDGFSEDEPDQFLDEKTALGELPGADYQAANNWLAQRRLLERIQEEGNPYPGNTDFTGFLTAADTNGLADYAALQIGIRQALAIGQEDQDSLQLYERQIITGLDSLTNLDRQLYAAGVSEQDSTALTDQRIDLLQAIEQSATAKTNLLGIIDSVRALNAAVLLTQNSSLLDAEKPYADNEKSVNDILLRTVMSGVFNITTQDSAALEIIAALCPLSDGEAVLRARALLTLALESPQAYDDEATCVVERCRPFLVASTDLLRIYPNPATEMIVVEYSLKEASKQNFLLWNMFGQLVKTIELPGNSGSLQIPLTVLPEGVYWYNVSGSKPFSISGKIIVNR